MLKISELIKNVPKEYISELTVSEDCEIDLDCRNACYIIKSGELLSYGANKFTQLLKTNDPIGVAETILGRSNELKYRRCLLYTSPSPRDATLSRMPSSA